MDFFPPNTFQKHCDPGQKFLIKPRVIGYEESHDTVPVSSVKLNESSKMWLLTSIAMHDVVLPALKCEVKEKFEKYYLSLVKSRKINSQTVRNYLHIDWEGVALNYKNINRNDRMSSPSEYNYNVAGPVDLAKLYLPENYIEVTDFEESLLPAAVFHLLLYTPLFHKDIKGLILQVKWMMFIGWDRICPHLYPNKVPFCPLCDIKRNKDWSFTEYCRYWILIQRLIDETKKKKMSERKLRNWKEKSLQLLFAVHIKKGIIKCILDEAQRLSQTLSKQKFQEIIYQDVFSSIHDYIHILKLLPEDQNNIPARKTSSFVSFGTGTSVVLEKKEMQCNSDLKCSQVQNIQESQKYGNSSTKTDYFTGRQTELEKIKEMFSVQNREFRWTVVEVIGCSGIGKTTLASKYASDQWNFYSGGIYWVQAESQQKIKQSLLQLAVEQGIKVFPPEETVENIFIWLSQKTLPWLFIIDNLEINHIWDSAKKIIFGTCKKNRCGHFVVTSQSSLIKPEEEEDLSLNQIELNCFTSAEGVEFLSKRTGMEITTDAELLVSQLGGMPLALEMASSLILKQGISYKKYLQKLNSLTLLTCTAEEGGPSDSLFFAVCKAWILTSCYLADKLSVKGLGDAALTVMYVCGFLDPDNIPNNFFNAGCPLVPQESLQTHAKDASAVKEILQLLKELSLIEIDDGILKIHCLLQVIMRRECMSKNCYKTILQTAMRMFRQALESCPSPTDESSQKRKCLHMWNNLMKQAHILQKHIKDVKKSKDIQYTDEFVIVLFHLAIYENLTNQICEAMKLRSFFDSLVTAMPLTKSIKKLLKLKKLQIPLGNTVQVELLGRVNTSPEDNSSDAPVMGKSTILELTEKCQQLVRKENFSDALEICSKVLCLIEDTDELMKASLFCTRAECNFRLEKLSEALEDAEKSIECDPTSAKAYVQKALICKSLWESSKHQGWDGLANAYISVAVTKDEKIQKMEEIQQKFPIILPCLILDNETEFLEDKLKSLLIPCVVLLKGKKYKFSRKSEFRLCDITIIGQPGKMTKIDSSSVVFVTNVILENISIAAGGKMKEGGQMQVTPLSSFYMRNCCLTGGVKADPRYEFRDIPLDPLTLLSRGSPPLVVFGNVRMDKCAIFKSPDGGLLVTSEGTAAHAVLKNCSIYQNGKMGLKVTEGSYMEVMSCSIYENDRQGILASQNVHLIVKNCNIYNNQNEGIFALNSTVHLEENIIHHNSLFGLSLTGITDSTIRKNKVFENGYWGIFIQRCYLSVVIKNYIHHNKCGGIIIHHNSSDDILFAQNNIHDHSGPAIAQIAGEHSEKAYEKELQEAQSDKSFMKSFFSEMCKMTGLRMEQFLVK